MVEIIKLGTYWGHSDERCDGCKFLEKSSPFSEDPNDILVACDAPDGRCVRNNKQVY